MQVTFGANVKFNLVGTPRQAEAAKKLIKKTITESPYLTMFKNFKYDNVNQSGAFELSNSMTRSVKETLEYHVPIKTGAKIDIVVD